MTAERVVPNGTLEDILRFVELTQKFQQIRRIILVKGEERQENDLEHSGQLALVASYICSARRLPMDSDLVIRYALVHDLVEAHAGDVSFYDTQARIGKAEREKKAAQQLKEDFPDFPELHTLIEQYNHRNDPESRFVYALDKVLPIMNIFLDKGRTWHWAKINLEMLTTHKIIPVSVNPTVRQLFDELVEILKEQPELFP